MADLRRLAKDCGFGDSLEKMLRDRLACGINDQTIQRKMLVEKDLTFKRALEIAEGTQAADQGCESQRGTCDQVQAQGEDMSKLPPEGTLSQSVSQGT